MRKPKLAVERERERERETDGQPVPSCSRDPPEAPDLRVKRQIDCRCSETPL